MKHRKKRERMKTTVYNGLDFFGEAVTLLEYLASEEPPSESRKQFMHKYGVSPEVLEKPFGVCTKIYEEGKRRLRSRREKIREYFTPYFEDGMLCKASFALLREFSDYESSLEKRKEICLGYSQERRSYEFYVLLQSGYQIQVEEDAQPKDCKNLPELLECLDRTELTAEQKWEIQWVFNHPAQAFQELEPCLKTAMEILREQEALWRPLVEQFCESWERRLADTGFYAYLKEQTNVSIEENARGAVLLPSVLAMGTISMCMDEGGKWEREPRADVFRMGVLAEQIGVQRLLDEDFTLGKKELAELLKILSDESKLEILSLLKERRYYGGELAKKLKLTTATISHHMSILVNNGLVTISKEQNRGYYALNEEAVRRLLSRTEELLLE